MRLCRHTVALLLFFNLPAFPQDTSHVATSFDYSYRKGLGLQQAGRYREAIASFEKALRVLPNNLDARVQLAQTLSWNRDYQRAEEEYWKVLGQQPDHFDARFGLAQTLAWQKNYGDAMREFQILLIRHPDNSEILRGIGEIYFWKQEYLQAAEYLERAVAAEPKSAAAHLNLADTYYHLQEWKQAHEQYQIVVNLAPSQTRALDQLRHTLVLTNTNQLNLSGFLELFSQEERTPHYALTAEYQRQLNKSIRLKGRLGFIRKRFDKRTFEDGSVGTGLMIRLAPKSVFSVNLNVAPTADVIPQVDFSSEFLQGALSRTQISVAYRLMDFDEVTVNIISPGLIYYFPGEAWAMLRAYGAFSEGADRTDALFGRFTYSFSRVISAWIGFTEGNEIIRGLSLDNLRNLSSRSYLFHIDYSVRNEFTLLLDYQYVIRRGLFTEHAFGLGVQYGW